MLAMVMPAAQLDAAEAGVRRCLTIAPTYASGHELLAYILMSKGRLDEAIEECELENSNGCPACLALAYHIVGNATASDAALDQAIETRSDKFAFGIVGVFAYRGQSEPAFERLERAYRDRGPAMPI